MRQALEMFVAIGAVCGGLGAAGLVGDYLFEKYALSKCNCGGMHPVHESWCDYNHVLD